MSKRQNKRSVIPEWLSGISDEEGTEGKSHEIYFQFQELGDLHALCMGELGLRHSEHKGNPAYTCPSSPLLTSNLNMCSDHGCTSQVLKAVLLRQRRDTTMQVKLNPSRPKNL